MIRQIKVQLRAVLLLAVFTALTTSRAFAQNETAPVYDHLRCYRARDSVKAMALADLITNEAQREVLPSETGCSIVVNSQEFCVPIDKQRKALGSKDAPYGDFVGFPLKNDFLCYKVRCLQTEGQLPTSLKVIDQFGEHTMSGFKTATICTPAYKDTTPVYETPTLYAQIISQNFDLKDRQASYRLLTSEPQEYHLASISASSIPAGWTLLSATEDLTSRNCPPGVPTLGEEGNACTQVWDIQYQLAPSVCDLDGNHTYTFDVDCNPAMPDCTLVNPAAPDEVVTFATASDDFCAAPPAAAPRLSTTLLRSRAR